MGLPRLVIGNIVNSDKGKTQGAPPLFLLIGPQRSPDMEEFIYLLIIRNIADIDMIKSFKNELLAYF